MHQDSELTKADVKHAMDVDELPFGFREQAFKWCTGHIESWEHLSPDDFEVRIVRFVSAL